MLTAFLDLCVDLRGISGEKSYTSKELTETTHVDCHIPPRLSLAYMTAIQNVLHQRGHLHSSELPGNSVDPISYFLIREHNEALTELTESRKLRLPLLVRLVQAFENESARTAVSMTCLSSNELLVSPYVRNAGHSLTTTVSFLLPFVQRMFTIFLVHERVALPDFRPTRISQRSPISTIHLRSLMTVRRLLLESVSPADDPAEFAVKCPNNLCWSTS